MLLLVCWHSTCKGIINQSTASAVTEQVNIYVKFCIIAEKIVVVVVVVVVVVILVIVMLYLYRAAIGNRLPGRPYFNLESTEWEFGKFCGLFYRTLIVH